MRALHDVLTLLVPHRCLACGRRADPPWCGACRRSAAPIPATACDRCGGGPEPGHGCWSPSAPVDATVAAYRYTGPVADAVVAAKLGGATSGWSALGTELADAAGHRSLEVDLVTWVPTEPGRRRARGIDHARALALPVADRLGRPAVAALRARPGVPDRGAAADGERRRPVPEDAFRAVLDLDGARCALVDDVLTTGDTAGRAAGSLRRSGARSVHLVVLARAGGHPLGGRGTEVPVGA